MTTFATPSLWSRVRAVFSPPKPDPRQKSVEQHLAAVAEQRRQRAIIRQSEILDISNRIVTGKVPIEIQGKEDVGDFWLNSYVDLLDRYREGLSFAYPITQPTDRRWGNNFPFWANEQQLGMLRAQARLIWTLNPNARGLITGLCSYTIGKGFEYQAVAKDEGTRSVAEKCQAVIDDFSDAAGWPQLEQELFERSRRDGEAFIRMFRKAGKPLAVRVVEPEQVFMKPGGTLDDWSYGLKNAPGDVTDILAYYVSYAAPGGKDQKAAPIGEEVPAEDVVHIKVNVDRNIKRGMPDLSFDTLELLTLAAKLRRNIGAGAAAQAAIAAVRQHSTATIDQVQAFQQDAVDFTFPIGGGRDVAVQRMVPGTFLDIPSGMEYVPPPGAANTEAYIAAMQCLLRNAGNLYNAPEWLSSGDSSNNNYASSLVAESPFVKFCERLQGFMSKPYRQVIENVLDHAATDSTTGVPVEWRQAVELNVVCPSVQSRDPVNEATVDQIYNAMGVKSCQTIAHENNLDYDKEKANIIEERSDEAMLTPQEKAAMDADAAAQNQNSNAGG